MSGLPTDAGWSGAYSEEDLTPSSPDERLSDELGHKLMRITKGAYGEYAEQEYQYIFNINELENLIKAYALEARLDERQLTVGEWNQASAKYGGAYSKRLYAIAKSGEKRIAQLKQEREELK